MQVLLKAATDKWKVQDGKIEILFFLSKSFVLKRLQYQFWTQIFHIMFNQLMMSAVKRPKR